MSEEFDNPVVATREKLRTKRRLENNLREARKSLATERERLRELGSVLKKEEADVRRLEGLSLTALFHSFLGGKEERLNKERQEMLTAKLRHDQCEHEVASLERDIEDLEAGIGGLGDPDAEYARALKEKESRIGGEALSGMNRLNERLADLNSDVKEFEEAVAAGDAVIAGLDSVIGYFKSAGNWGIVDLVGGGLIVTAVKHSKIDRAKAGINDVQSRLGRFQRELADLRLRPDSSLRVEISSFEKFADYLFDGLIFDWIVQAKIRKSLDAAVDMRGKMVAVVGDLRRQLDGRRKDRESAEREIRDFLEKA